MPKQKQKQKPRGNPSRDIERDYGVFQVPYLGAAQNCPETIRNMFKSVEGSKYLTMDYFGNLPEREGFRGVFDTNAAHDYNMELKKRAEELHNRCTKPKMVDAPEKKWVDTFATRVFLRLDCSEEENVDAERPFNLWYFNMLLLCIELINRKSCLPSLFSTRKPANHRYFQYA